MLIAKRSIWSGVIHTRDIDVDHDVYADICERLSNDCNADEQTPLEYVPDMPLDDREFIAFGITPEEWQEKHPEEPPQMRMRTLVGDHSTGEFPLSR